MPHFWQMPQQLFKSRLNSPAILRKASPFFLAAMSDLHYKRSLRAV